MKGVKLVWNAAETRPAVYDNSVIDCVCDFFLFFGLGTYMFLEINYKLICFIYCAQYWCLERENILLYYYKYKQI